MYIHIIDAICITLAFKYLVPFIDNQSDELYRNHLYYLKYQMTEKFGNIKYTVIYVFVIISFLNLKVATNTCILMMCPANVIITYRYQHILLKIGQRRGERIWNITTLPPLPPKCNNYQIRLICMHCRLHTAPERVSQTV